jgi:hypothetical protein
VSSAVHGLGQLRVQGDVQLSFLISHRRTSFGARVRGVAI